jgi:hypothetical protein
VTIALAFLAGVVSTLAALAAVAVFFNAMLWASEREWWG